MTNRFHSIKSGGFFNIRYIFGGILCLLLLVLTTCGKDSPTKPSPPAPPTPVATRITVIPASSNLEEIYQTVQLRATVFDQNNNTIAGASVVWSSSNTVVASVGLQGLVTALKNGTSQITAQSGSVSGVATVTVMAPLPNQSPAAVDTIAAQVLTEGGSQVEGGRIRVIPGPGRRCAVLCGGVERRPGSHGDGIGLRSNHPSGVGRQRDGNGDRHRSRRVEGDAEHRRYGGAS